MRRARSGFSLMELMMGIVMITIILSLGFSNLGKARTSGGSRGLATAVAAEFSLARETAMSKGTPLALVVPAGSGGVGRSLFFLEGNSNPRVTRVVDFSGDYPRGAITVATYAGPDFSKPMRLLGSKAAAWSGGWLSTWLGGADVESPASLASDFVFFFTPSGEVVTNNLPGTGGNYQVIVGTEAEVSGSPPSDVKILAAGEPFTVVLSQSGAVSVVGHLPGSSGGVNTLGATTNVTIAKAPTFSSPDPESDRAPAILSKRITPGPVKIDDVETFVLDKGEFITLEAYARSGDGRPLYTKWVDTPPADKIGAQFKGRFSVVGGGADGVRQRMDFFPELEVPDEITGELKLEKNVWRSVWTWTPPPAAVGGDKYSLDIDVTDFSGDVKVELPDPPKVLINLPGEIVFERFDPASNHWQLFTMWADGKGKKQITKGGHDYRCASATANGSMIAYERDESEVWVMNSDTSRPTKVAVGRCPTISPTGDTIAYFNADFSRVFVKRLGTLGSDDGDIAPGGVASTSTVKTTVKPLSTLANSGEVPGNRIAYSTNGRYVYFPNDRSDPVDPAHPEKEDFKVKWMKIGFSTTSENLIGTDGRSGDITDGNVASIPQIGGLSIGRKGELFYHADGNDPYLAASTVVDQAKGGSPAAPEHRLSVNVLEIFPAISPNQDQLLYCKAAADGSTVDIHRVPKAGWTSISTPDSKLTDGGVNLRPAWIRQRKAITEP